jgi:CheY-like chemotaxis protein
VTTIAKDLMTASLLQVLLVEDDPGDAALLVDAFGDHPASRLHHVVDGARALAFLRRADPYGDAPRPDLILLDLNMPRMDGRETLSAIKSDERLKAIPVVILTTSGAAPDIASSYQHRANAYVTKPFGLDDFEATVRQIDRFYREIASLPHH